MAEERTNTCCTVLHEFYVFCDCSALEWQRMLRHKLTPPKHGLSRTHSFPSPPYPLQNALAYQVRREHRPIQFLRPDKLHEPLEPSRHGDEKGIVNSEQILHPQPL